MVQLFIKKDAKSKFVSDGKSVYKLSDFGAHVSGVLGKPCKEYIRVLPQ
jgi:hypothetical protein